MTDGLVLEAVGHDYDGVPVVGKVSLRVGPGELVCLLGPSGCGKTTTLRISAGLEVPRRGRVILNGRVVSGGGVHLPPEERHVGFLFQDFALFPHLDVLANVAFGLTALARPARRERAMQMLTQVGMGDYAGAWPHQLSGGQQQRVALARALAPSPALMLLDEPFSGLDKRLRDQVRDETLHVLKSSRVSTLMVTHDPEEAMFMADRIAVMRGGDIVQMGSPDELYNHPRDAFVASFFGEVNLLDGVVRHGRVVTPLGEFAAPPSLAEGSAAEVLARPEALSLTVSERGWATVLASRLLGRSSLVHLRVERDGMPACHLHARLSAGVTPAEGQRVSIAVDPARVFVFPGPNLP
ncbi:ABC transporter ATP-binding protein [Magnetospirillum sp. SS-4]|uniref:ABC transporter ATP-binding protein n=1 Tax=Magnetospirillum sp. SS-4 TaxID=2681465 RepID=UPI001380810F|nr:ABC transporter ATP-binding protein [Magnetospirillum sp. SS-4]CAA7620829.1 putative spermidine/putrescine ABC transporter,(ATP-binding protein) [Magnetospirillum sp. SS-4]